MERNRASYLSLSILVCNTFGKPFLSMNLMFENPVKKKPSKHTFVNTAIEAYELPKLMPTTGGKVEICIGASALPFSVVFAAIRSKMSK
jgi:hypothetical protein